MAMAMAMARHRRYGYDYDHGRPPRLPAVGETTLGLYQDCLCFLRIETARSAHQECNRRDFQDEILMAFGIDNCRSAVTLINGRFFDDRTNATASQTTLEALEAGSHRGFILEPIATNNASESDTPATSLDNRDSVYGNLCKHSSLALQV